MTRAAIYLRVSSAQQEDNYSLSTQEAGCRSYCERHGYTVDKRLIWTDVHSGAYLFGRKGAESLLNAIRARQVDVVVAYAIDRLSRNQNHLGLLLSEAEHYSVRLEFVTEQLDDTLLGKQLRSLITFAGELEREKFKERSQRGKIARVKAGRPLHGRRPLYGYHWNEDKTAYLIYEPEADIVRQIYSQYASGKTLGRIVVWLNDNHVPPPCDTGKRRWWQSGVHNILKHPSYWGEAKAYRHRVERQFVASEFGDKSHYVKRYICNEPGGQYDVAAGVPAIITDPDMVEIVELRLTHNKAALAGRKNYRVQALLRGGFAVCGYCGHRMVTQPRAERNGGPFYLCGSNSSVLSRCSKHSIAVHILDDLVWRRIKKLLTQPEVVAAELERQRTADPTEADINNIDRILADITRRRENLRRGLELARDEDTISTVTAQLDELAARKRGYEQEREEMLKYRRAWQLTQHRIDTLQAWCRALLPGLSELTYEQKREALFALGVTVKVYRKDHDPRWILEASIPLPEDPPIFSQTSSGIAADSWRRTVASP